MRILSKIFWLMCFFLLMKPGSVWSRAFMTQGQALNLVFSSGTVIERKNLYLNDEQKKNIELRAKSKLDFGLVTYYVGTNADGGTNGFVFFNSHRVRTMPETMMACVNPDGSLRLVEILAFYEPADYLPPKKWFELFPNKKLNEDLWVKRGIRNVTGATLTTQAITENVRRILAIFEVAIKPELKEKK